MRSPVRNVGVRGEAFVEAVREEFRKMYGAPDLEVEMGEAADFAHEQIEKGVAELVVRTVGLG